MQPVTYTAYEIILLISITKLSVRFSFFFCETAKWQERSLKCVNQSTFYCTELKEIKYQISLSPSGSPGYIYRPLTDSSFSPAFS
jgi:hypothetical protein